MVKCLLDRNRLQMIVAYLHMYLTKLKFIKKIKNLLMHNPESLVSEAIQKKYQEFPEVTIAMKMKVRRQY